MTFLSIILSTVLISILSMIGILIFFTKEKINNQLLIALVALSAGTMLGNSIFHLLPEAIESAALSNTSLFTVLLILTLGFVLSFMMEQFFSWHHCHEVTTDHDKNKVHCDNDIKPFSRLVLYSDAIHNFIDGLIIAAAFIVSPPLGIATTIAIAFHEVPQELSDYAVLVYGGYKKTRALILNYVASFTVVLGGIVGFLLSSKIEQGITVLLPFAAGSFLYIAAADLLPELKHKEKTRETALHFIIFLAGLTLMIAFAVIE